jgi:hypothetical protein
MLTEKEMNEIADKYISTILIGTDIKGVILHEYTINKPYGNIYFYNSETFTNTGNDKFALIGNAPFLVENKTGNVVVFGTSQPEGYYIKEYEEGRWVSVQKKKKSE